jgi:hypothetical protein
MSHVREKINTHTLRLGSALVDNFGDLDLTSILIFKFILNKQLNIFAIVWS